MTKDKYLISNFEALGTVWYIEVFENLDSDKKVEIAEKIKSEILNFQNTYSRFLVNSALNELNYNKSVEFDHDLWQMISLGLDFEKFTEGIFDLFIKKDLESKGYGRGLDREDIPANINVNLPKVNLEGGEIILNTDQHIDLGGIGKGYLIDKLAKLLQDLDLKYFLINGGGDIYATSDLGRPIRLHLEHPQEKDLFIGEVELLNQSLCASSNYKRSWIVNSKKENHFVGKISSLPTASFIISDTATIADVFATVFCIESDAEKLNYLSMKYNSQALVLAEDKIKFLTKNFNVNLYI